jgi:hypothetical protein
MIINDVLNKLTYEMIIRTGHFEDSEIYREYLRMALVIGMEHFRPDMEEIVALNEFGVEVGRFKSVSDASKKLNIKRQSIDKVLVGKCHSAGKLIFRKCKLTTY